MSGTAARRRAAVRLRPQARQRRLTAATGAGRRAASPVSGRPCFGPAGQSVVVLTARRWLYATDFEDHSPPGVHEVASHATSLLDASHFTSVHERDVAVVYRHVHDGGEAAAHPASDLVASGLRMQSSRSGSDFTDFDGKLSRRLEAWAECGFRYFLGYVLGLSERDNPERTIELSALDRGSAVHDVLERFMREMVEGSRTTNGAARQVALSSGKRRSWTCWHLSTNF